MKKTNSESFKNKFFFLLICGLIYLTVLIAALYIFFTNGSGFVLLYTPLFILCSAAIGSFIWHKKYADIFETLLVYISYTSIGFAFIFLAPIAIDRSLSTFIFFYAVEHEYYPANAISQQYKDAFFQKRLEDGINGKFLTYENNTYKPTYRAKLYYSIFYPLGIATNTLSNYKIFAAEINNQIQTEHTK